MSDATSANASLSVAYSNVDWDFLKVVYGWAAVQYQAWARGELHVGGNETQHLVLHTDTILEFWVDDQHYFGGDFYTYRKAPPVLHLQHLYSQRRILTRRRRPLQPIPDLQLHWRPEAVIPTQPKPTGAGQD
jgi:hypothetical protein